MRRILETSLCSAQLSVFSKQKLQNVKKRDQKKFKLSLKIYTLSKICLDRSDQRFSEDIVYNCEITETFY